ncbi:MULTISPECIES: hypothetical protein [unclassified Oceanobacillus]|uniref:hypothetical protein n=1 Tax=unclassified Oceanobacillus TaxID=2630292 RepID=UPI00300E1CF3
MNRQIFKRLQTGYIEKNIIVICKNGPIAVQSTKEAVIRLLSLPMELGFHEEWKYASKALGSEDIKEGLKAFVEKREPVYKGQ